MYWVILAAVFVGGSIVLVWLILLHRTLRRFGVLLKDIHKRPTVSPPPTLTRSSNPENPVLLSWIPGTVPRRIVHDLNNYLGTISGFTDAALEDISDDSPVLSDLKEIRGAVRKAKEVIAELNTISKSRGSTLQSATPHWNAEINSVIGAVGGSGKGKIGSEESLLPVEKATPRDSPHESSNKNWEGDISLIPKKGIPTGTEHLFIVDDEMQLLRMFRRFFEPLGYKVTKPKTRFYRIFGTTIWQ